MDEQAANAIPDAEPFELFAEWFADARKSELNDPEAVAVATATPDGAPSVRMVLMKDFSPAGFVFYTNGHSRKGGELAANPQAAMLFHWKSLRRQVRIEGLVSEVDPAEADAYFHSRSRDSQLGALASDQSAPLDSRTTFLKRIASVTARHLVGTVPRPPHWTGFRLAPHAIEFWMDRPFRLHERRRFTRLEGGGWTSTLLYP
ncbi:pyridoxamine 5'-phosphate oxidase [Novosphingobium sp.]|uniref:pyridoxamine 5'-phosphate oxidase n=1 Tax=Novosphingobium sp. TaxID=1874826 RepID=UPI001EC29317|nr:pyridoxamine 5'-phosphate oxidase [Novosphingobium sp.]MBK6802842.1 pyridoxamine 5'-phosphate oxidase [Novosphingobium sp.]MBK9012311.1 pyridoxamine 5'-phosphate oxidase [Novosphingobium sp.]